MAEGRAGRGAGHRPGIGLTALLSPQTRKPLVEKKRRARINESLQELRSLLADSEVRRRWRGGRRGRAAGPGAVLTAGRRVSFRRSWRTRRCWS